MPRKGQHMTDEQKRKLSEARKGMKLSDETKRKMSDSMKGKFSGANHPMYGKKHSAETRQKMSDAQKGEKNHFHGKHHSDATKQLLSEANGGENNPLYGKSRSEETKQRISAAQLGEKNHMWNGGSSLYNGFTSKMREEIRQRDNYTCQNCGSVQESADKAFAVHHIDGTKDNHNPDNLITLCQSCHSRHHRLEEMKAGIDHSRNFKGS